LPAFPEKGVAVVAGTFGDCNECPEMVTVPSGSFMMGSNEDISEQPLHLVTIARPFAVGKFEITFEQWDACVAGGGCNSYRPDDRGWGRGRRPVIHVSWEDAKAYVTWLAGKTGKAYRLLTEAEWEYAARAGTKTEYYWGDKIGSGNANCWGCGSRWDNKQTAPVGSFKPNRFGLYDMLGNVWEWVEDCGQVGYAGAQAGYAGAPTDGSAVTGNDCTRVFRGGCWRDYYTNLRSANRPRSISARSEYIGFRVGMTL